MKNSLTYELEDLNYDELRSVSGGHGGPPPGGIAYRSHGMHDFFRGVLHGLSSMWK
jgi:hypothetical protein